MSLATNAAELVDFFAYAPDGVEIEPGLVDVRFGEFLGRARPARSRPAFARAPAPGSAAAAAARDLRGRPRLRLRAAPSARSRLWAT
jgi:hypothetical protein